jgi:acetyltransferase-like isoleucine patch superfamily enzyme
LVSSDESGFGRNVGSTLLFNLMELGLKHAPPFVGARTITTALRLGGARIAPSTIFWGMPTLTGTGDAAKRLTIGEFCGLNYGCVFELEAAITLEEHVAVGHEVLFLTRTRDVTESTQRGKAAEAKPIVIGAGSWLGSRCVILPGVTIGPGSVIGASVVVRENVPANMLVAGARKIPLAKWR